MIQVDWLMFNDTSKISDPTMFICLLKKTILNWVIFFSTEDNNMWSRKEEMKQIKEKEYHFYYCSAGYKLILLSENIDNIISH